MQHELAKPATTTIAVALAHRVRVTARRRVIPARLRGWSSPALAGLCSLLVCPSPTSASIVRIEPNLVTGAKAVAYRAAPGEFNSVSMWSGLDSVNLGECCGSTGLAITPEAPCATPAPPAANSVSCPRSGVDLVVADLDDEDDTFGGMIYTLPVAVAGGSGRDSLNGGDLDDLLLGEDGADILRGGPGNDVLDGGPGPDRIEGDFGVINATMTGFDLVDYSDRTLGVTVTLDGRADDGEAGEQDNVAADVEDVDGGSGPDVIVGNDRANQLSGNDGNDIVTGGSGADLLDGGGGDDTIQARDGAVDDVRCGTGSDTVIADANDTVAADCEPTQGPSTPPPAPPAPAPAPASRDSTPPTVSTNAPRRPTRRSVIAQGLRISVACSEPCTLNAELQMSRATARSLGIPTRPSSKTIVIGRGAGTASATERATLTVKLTATARRAVRRLRQQRLTLLVTAKDSAGNTTRTTTTIRPRAR